jgi:hypothetical protein
MFGKYLYYTFTGPTLSTSTSSFEALDPHDPNLSRLATTMFQKTADYLFGELTATQVWIIVYCSCAVKSSVLPLDIVVSHYHPSPLCSCRWPHCKIIQPSKLCMHALSTSLWHSDTSQDWVTKCLVAWILNYALDHWEEEIFSSAHCI